MSLLLDLAVLLQESVRQHYHCDDSTYCCPACKNSDHYMKDGDCDCGADEWNSKVAAFLERIETEVAFK